VFIHMCMQINYSMCLNCLLLASMRALRLSRARSVSMDAPMRGRARSVHDHGTSGDTASVHRYKLLRYMSMTTSVHRVIRLRYKYQSEYGPFRYIHFGTLSHLPAY